jgi:hypothetical protein
LASRLAQRIRRGHGERFDLPGRRQCAGLLIVDGGEHAAGARIGYLELGRRGDLEPVPAVDFGGLADRQRGPRTELLVECGADGVDQRLARRRGEPCRRHRGGGHQRPGDRPERTIAAEQHAELAAIDEGVADLLCELDHGRAVAQLLGAGLDQPDRRRAADPQRRERSHVIAGDGLRRCAGEPCARQDRADQPGRTALVARHDRHAEIRGRLIRHPGSGSRVAGTSRSRIGTSRTGRRRTGGGKDQGWYGECAKADPHAFDLRGQGRHNVGLGRRARRSADQKLCFLC